MTMHSNACHHYNLIRSELSVAEVLEEGYSSKVKPERDCGLTLRRSARPLYAQKSRTFYSLSTLGLRLLASHAKFQKLPR